MAATGNAKWFLKRLKTKLPCDPEISLLECILFSQKLKELEKRNKTKFGSPYQETGEESVLKDWSLCWSPGDGCPNATAKPGAPPKK